MNATTAAAPAPPPVLQKMPPVLKGQVAVVTGSSSGIGQDIAIAMGLAGANVVLNYAHSEAGADEAAEKIRAAGQRAIVVPADVSREADVQSLFSRACQELGTVDILVNNSGIEEDVAFDEMTLAQWQRVIDVNLTGQFLCAREAVREFKRRGIRPSVSSAAGKIICISSVHEIIPWAGHVNYAASKGGVMLMMKSLAQEMAPAHIRVNSIGPGAIRTHINRHAWDTPQAYADLMTMIPYGRIGETDDVARLAVWLASDQSDYITGTTIIIDGGMTLYPSFAGGKG